MNLDSGLPHLVASLLIVLVLGRIASEGRAAALWAFAAYSLVGLGASLVVLLLLGLDIELPVFFFVASSLGGILWTVLAAPHTALHWRGHGLSLATSGLLVAGAASAAMNYRWWMAPAVLLWLTAMGAIFNGWPRQGDASSTALAPGVAEGSSTDQTAARLGATTALAGPAPSGPGLRLTCFSCGRRSTLDVRLAGRLVYCPRCKASMRVPSAQPREKISGPKAPETAPLQEEL